MVVYLLLFSGAGATAGAELELFAFRESSVLGGAFSGNLVSVVATAAVTAGLLAPWLGALLLARRLEGGERLAALWLAALVVAAVGPFVLLSQTGLAQIYFFHYATPAGRPAVGMGRQPGVARAAQRAPAVAGAGGAAGSWPRAWRCSSMPAPPVTPPAPRAATSLPYLVLVAVIAAVAFALERRVAPGRWRWR